MLDEHGLNEDAAILNESRVSRKRANSEENLDKSTSLIEPDQSNQASQD